MAERKKAKKNVKKTSTRKERKISKKCLHHVHGGQKMEALEKHRHTFFGE